MDFIEFVAFFGGTIFSLMTALATVLIVNELRELRRDKRRQYTGEMITRFSQQNSFPYQEYRKDVLAEIVNEKYTYTKPELDQKRQVLIEHLNSLEVISTLLNEGTLDELTYKGFARGRFIRAFHELRPFILDLRESTGNSRIFEQFERVVRRWERSDDIR